MAKRIESIYANIMGIAVVNPDAWVRIMKQKRNGPKPLIDYAIYIYVKNKDINNAIKLLEESIHIGLRTGIRDYEQEAIDVLQYLCPKHVITIDKNICKIECVYKHT